MSTVVTIPLENNKDIAALVADKQPADKIYGCFTIKAKDDKSLVLRIEELTDKKEDLPDADSYDEDEEKEGGPAEKDNPEEAGGNGSSPSESSEAIRLASPMGGYTGP